jgi:hypothetical protein
MKRVKIVLLISGIVVTILLISICLFQSRKIKSQHETINMLDTMNMSILDEYNRNISIVRDKSNDTLIVDSIIQDSKFLKK